MISRRLFFIGSSAALAVAALPRFASPDIIPIHDSGQAVRRWLYDVCIEGGEAFPGPGNGGSQIILGNPDRPRMQFVIGPHGMFRWVGYPGNEIWLKTDQEMLGLIDCWPPQQSMKFQFIYRDTFDDEGYCDMVQTFQFNGLDPIVCGALPIYPERQYPVGHPKYVSVAVEDSEWEDCE